MTAARIDSNDGRFRKLVHGVKYIEGEFYLRCESCWRAHRACYWPLTTEFWWPKQGLTRCIACWNTYRRMQKAKRDRRERGREYYAEARAVILMKKRLHYAENRERYCAKKRERYAKRRAAEGKPYTPQAAA